MLQASAPRGRYRKAPSSPAPRGSTNLVTSNGSRGKKEKKKALLRCRLYLALPRKPTAVTFPTWRRRVLGARSRERCGAVSLPSAFTSDSRGHRSPTAGPAPCPARWGRSRCSRRLPAPAGEGVLPTLVGHPRAPSRCAGAAQLFQKAAAQNPRPRPPLTSGNELHFPLRRAKPAHRLPSISSATWRVKARPPSRSTA